MKKNLLLLLAVLLSAQYAVSGPVSRRAAQSVAAAYLSARGVELKEEPTPYRAPRRGASAQSENAYYYVFNAGNDNGYVIVSGDDRTDQILGYVDKGSFNEESIPENMRSWLQFYADEINRLDEKGVTLEDVKKARARRAKPTRHSVPELMKTRWNQGDPYNLSCPDYYNSDGTKGRPASGCVATALTQVMYYYQHPARIKTPIPSITNTYTLDDGTTKTVTTKNIGRVKIDWENMLPVYDGDETEEQRQAVADLMYYMGQAVNMGYGSSSGAVHGTNVAEAFQKYFGYDDSIYLANRGDYSIDEWFDLLYTEIAAGHPISFSGTSSGGGHAFVLDGFDGENLFHVNWGWGGGSNGWFLIGILNPGDNSGIGASGSSDGYSMGQDALMSVRLPDNERVEPNVAMSINDVQIVNDTEIKANYINWTGGTNTFNTGIVLLNEDTTCTLISKQVNSTLDRNYYHTRTFDVKGLLDEGTYKISPASKVNGKKIWRPKYRHNSPEYIRAEVDAEGNTKLTLVKPNLSISIDTVIFAGNRVVNTEQEVQVVFKNNGDEYDKEICLLAGTEETMEYQDSRCLVPIRKGESTTVSFFFTPTTTGTYTLSFCNSSDGSGEVGRTQVEVRNQEDVELANLSVGSFIFTNSQNGTIYGDRMVGRVTVKNNGSEMYNGEVKVQLWRQPAGSNTAWSSSSTTSTVSIEPAKLTSVPFEFYDLDNTTTYRLLVTYGNTQSGDLVNGGLWEHGWVLSDGILYWKEDGTMVGTKLTSTASARVNTNACGFYLSQDKVRRVSTNRNPNTIHVMKNGISTPSGMDKSNLIVDGHSEQINITDGYPFYMPVNFTADSVNFHHTFPETTDGSGWETFTLPFAADSISIDSVKYALNDDTNHFWVYEFGYLGDNNEVLFTPASELRGNTPYIIAADETLAGKTITFSGKDISFNKSGSDKILISSDAFKQYGTTYKESVTGAYILNEEGTAFCYTADETELNAISTYFLTSLSDEEKPEQILLPEVPKSNLTGIVSTKTDNKAVQPIFNMMGQKVGTTTPSANAVRGLKSGIYIINGKKILVK